MGFVLITLKKIWTLDLVYRLDDIISGLGMTRIIMHKIGLYFGFDLGLRMDLRLGTQTCLNVEM